jgi:hypothetical protein
MSYNNIKTKPPIFNSRTIIKTSLFLNRYSIYDNNCNDEANDIDEVYSTVNNNNESPSISTTSSISSSNTIPPSTSTNYQILNDNVFEMLYSVPCKKGLEEEEEEEERDDCNISNDNCKKEWEKVIKFKF